MILGNHDYNLFGSAEAQIEFTHSKRNPPQLHQDGTLSTDGCWQVRGPLPLRPLTPFPDDMPLQHCIKDGRQ